MTKQNINNEIINELKAIKVAFENTFSTIDGRTVLKALYNDCTSMLGEFEENPLKASFNEGRRHMLKQILAYAKPDLLSDKFGEMTSDIFNEITNWANWTK